MKVVDIVHPERGLPGMINAMIVLSTTIAIFHTIKALHDEGEISEDDGVSPFPNKLTDDGKEMELTIDIGRIKVNRKDIEGPELRITPKIQGTRVFIDDTDTISRTGLQEFELDGERATSRVMIQMPKDVNEIFGRCCCNPQIRSREVRVSERATKV